MKLNRPRFPRGLFITIVVLLALGLMSTSVINRLFTEKQLANNVLLAAIPFLLIFVAVILVYIAIIVIVASMLSNAIPEGTYVLVERICIAGIVLGMVGMFQPWALLAYKYGFILLVVSTLAYILWSHITPKEQQFREELEKLATR